MDEAIEKVFKRKNVDYFWEYEAAFGFFFLKKLFQKENEKFYRMECSSFLEVDGKTYEVKLRNVRSAAPADSKEVKGKIEILHRIQEGLSFYQITSTTSKGKFLYFPLGKFICELELVEKRKSKILL